MNKSPIAAFLLSFIPGVGHAYLGRYVRFILYAGGFFGPLGLLFLMLASGSHVDGGITFFIFFIAAISAFVNMLDMVISLLRGKANEGAYPSHAGYAESAGYGYDAARGAGTSPSPEFATHGHGPGEARGHVLSYEQQQEKTRTFLLSIIPGLGHMSMGLMQRGITFLISFVGLFVIIVFLSAIMGSGVVLIFLLALPVIWIYSMFDAASLLHAKQRGEVLEDKSLFEGVESHIASGRKNKVLAISLAMFPGAGHLYIGLQKRGLQLMAGFLLAIYIMDNLRLSLFLFLLPLFWCFAFFDALQQISRYERQQPNDEPLLPVLVPYQRWFGVGLLGFGVYFLLDRIVINVVGRYWPEIVNHYTAYKYMLPTAVIAFVMIVFGLRLAFGSGSVIGASKAPERLSSFSNEKGDGE